MKTLILEDDPERHSAFLEMDPEAVIVETVKGAIRYLETETWDRLFLDHDLGGAQMVASGPGTGYEVAVWLEEHPDRQPKWIYLHSLNPAGRARMKQALPKAQERPWVWDTRREIKVVH